MSKYKKLLSNSFIFGVGNLGSKLISIILVPLYTYYLSTSQFGAVDILTTTISLFLPLISLSIFDAVLRFVLDKSEDNKSILSNALFVNIMGVLIIIFVYPVLKKISLFEGEILYFLVILSLQSVQSLFAQFTRAIGNIKTYAFNGILMTLITGAMNILLLVKFGMGVDGYLISIVIANIISIIYIVSKVKIYNFIDFSTINPNLIKKMLVYSIPLIPNAFMWWIINASNRYFILYFIGISANGLYAVASKMPILLSILNSIFFQAWQLTAIEEYEENNKSDFHSEVFSYFSMLMFIGTSGIIMILKPVIKYTFSSDYYSAWMIVPFLLMGVVFSSFSSFLGTTYIAAKKTKGVFWTSLVGGLVNVISNLIFIPIWGIVGAAISTVLSFLIIWIIRIIDTKKYINMQTDLKSVIINLLIILIQISILFFNLKLIFELIINIIFFVFIIIYNRKNILAIVSALVKKKK